MNALLLQGASGEVIPHVGPHSVARSLLSAETPERAVQSPGGWVVHVVGDVIQVGWYGYYWLPDTMRFEAVLIQD